MKLFKLKYTSYSHDQPLLLVMGDSAHRYHRTLQTLSPKQPRSVSSLRHEQEENKNRCCRRLPTRYAAVRPEPEHLRRRQ